MSEAEKAAKTFEFIRPEPTKKRRHR